MFHVLLLSLTLHAAEPTQLRQVLDKYRKAKMVEMQTEKVVKLELLDKEMISTGKMFLSGKLFRWEVLSPDKNLLVFDGKILWNEQAPPEGFAGMPTQVSKMTIDKANKDHQVMLSLFEYDGVKKNFDFTTEKKIDKLIEVSLTAKQKSFAVKKMKMILNPEKKILTEISYTDDIGNMTKVKFISSEFLKKSKPEMFQYKPPKNAQVIPL